MAKGFKIVSLAIDEDQEVLPALGDSSVLRQAAWYPSIPAERCCLNTSWLWHPQLLHTGYRPFILLDFGGSRGERLSNITGLAVQYSNGLHSIEILYKQTPGPCASKKLGRCDTSEVPPSTIFKIRGENGERITAVDVAVQKRGSLQTVNTLLDNTVTNIRVSLLQLSLSTFRFSLNLALSLLC